MFRGQTWQAAVDNFITHSVRQLMQRSYYRLGANFCGAKYGILGSECKYIFPQKQGAAVENVKVNFEISNDNDFIYTSCRSQCRKEKSLLKVFGSSKLHCIWPIRTVSDIIINRQMPQA